jgi:hypothetical protein
MSGVLMKKFDKNDRNVRMALLKVYDRSDFYNGERLQIENFQVDHLICESVSDEELNAYKEMLDLPSDFNRNSLINLVPVTPKTNRRKSDIRCSLHNLRHYFTLTKSKAPKLEEEIEKNRREVKLENVLSRVATEDYKKSCELLEKVEATLYPGERTFRSENKDYPDSLVRSGLFVRLVGLFSTNLISPTDLNSSPSCLILFKSLMIRDCSITFSEPYISKVLLSGLNTPINEMKRSFIRGYNEEYGYFVHLGNNSIWLNHEELSELCEILDSYGERFFKWKYETIEKYGLVDLEPSNIYPGAYRLFRIKKKLWSDILNFSWQFEHSKGTSPWNMFEHNVGNFFVISRDEDSRFTHNFHAWIRAEQVETFMEESLIYSDDSVWLVWNPSSLTEGEQYSFEGKWSAKVTKDFLLTEMIPYVIYRLETKHKIFKKSFSKFSETFWIDDYVYYS